MKKSRRTSQNAAGCVGSYAVEVKPSARKEPEALGDGVLARVFKKIESLGHVPRPPACKKEAGEMNRGIRCRSSPDWGSKGTRPFPPAFHEDGSLASL